MEENIKKILKTIKLHESTISTLIGLFVVVGLGTATINYFKNKSAELPVISDQEISEPTDIAEKQEFSETPSTELPPFTGELPTTYKVRAGDNLWEIAERYYQTGYAWVEISQINNLTNPETIEKDQELAIPQLAKAYPLTVTDRQPAIGGASSTSEFDEPVASEQTENSIVKTDISSNPVDGTIRPIIGNRYTVQKGDHLWLIAVRAYNDGYKWVEIARANNIQNPNIIHSGLELTLPR